MLYIFSINKHISFNAKTQFNLTPQSIHPNLGGDVPIKEIGDRFLIAGAEEAGALCTPFSFLRIQASGLDAEDTAGRVAIGK